MKTPVLIRLFPAFLPVFLFAGCGDDPAPSAAGGDDPSGDVFEERQIPDAFRNGVDDLVEGNNAFAFDLYRELKNDDGNIFFSPFSISTALAMTYAGAAGETAAEMADALYFPGDGGELHPSYGALLASLDRGSAMEGYILAPANRLWGQTGYAFLPSFLDVTGTHYQAGFEALDFASGPEVCRLTINKWVEEKTAGTIEELLPQAPPVITAQTKLVLTNAIYFKGNWQTKFDTEETEERPFFRADGSDVNVPMMYTKACFPRLFLDDAVVLELPYQGRDLSMILVSPNDFGGLPAIEERLGAELLDDWIGRLEPDTIEVYLPRFKMESSFSLSGAMEALGMELAFTPAADFSGITGSPGLYISAILHKGFVEVNEEGSEAAAATAVVMTDSFELPFNGNHPFLFLIRDNLTGSVLFLGRVSDPS